MKFFSNNSKKVRALIIVPKAERNKVFKTFHDQDASGHMSFRSTLYNIRSKYYWPKMVSETKNYCDTCEICFMNNQSYRKKPKCPMRSFPSGYPNQCVAIDLFGPFVKKKNTYKYILTIMCRYTRFLQAVPLITATSPEIARALIDNWFFRWGIPDSLLSDQGANLVTSELMKELYQLLNIDKRQTTAYRPQTNGMVERKHRDIANVIRKIVGNNPENWKSILPIAVFAINMAVCKTTGYSPYQLILSYNIRGPSDLIFDTTTSVYYQSQKHLGSANFQKFREVFDQVRSNIADSLVIQKRTYDRQANFTRYQEGDLVLLYKPLPPTTKEYKKFLNKFSGPHQITKIISDNNYVIKLKDSGKENVVHYDHLRFYKKALRNVNKPYPESETNTDKTGAQDKMGGGQSSNKGKEKAPKKSIQQQNREDDENDLDTNLNYIGPCKLDARSDVFTTKSLTPIAHRTRRQTTGVVGSNHLREATEVNIPAPGTELDVGEGSGRGPGRQEDTQIDIPTELPQIGLQGDSQPGGSGDIREPNEPAPPASALENLLVGASRELPAIPGSPRRLPRVSKRDRKRTL